MSNFTAVFIAATVGEADFVERLLDDEGIEYKQRLEPFLKERETSGVCYQGIMFEVLGGQAAFCRRLLAERGLARGVVDGE